VLLLLTGMLLQIQMRDIPGFVETRYRLLQLRPNNRNNWVTFSVAHHLDGNHDMAVQIISGFESTVVRPQEEGVCVGGGGGGAVTRVVVVVVVRERCVLLVMDCVLHWRTTVEPVALARACCGLHPLKYHSAQLSRCCFVVVMLLLLLLRVCCRTRLRPMRHMSTVSC